MATPYQPKQAQVPYGLHIPYDKGYDARSRAKTPAAEALQPSGYLLHVASQFQVDLWITEISADFSLSGQTGQSRMLREFFPRSFNDVTLNIVGNVASTQEFNRLAAFVRQMQWQALQAINAGSSASQTLTFGLFDNTPDFKAARTVKGSHRPWLVNGYVQKIAAGAVTQEVAPQFQLNFVVAESTFNANTGLWSDVAAPAQSLQTMLALVNTARKQGTVSGGFIRDPVATLQQTTAAQQKQAVQSGNKALKGVSKSVWSVASTLNGGLFK